MSDEVVFLSAENSEDMLGEFAATYFFSPISGRPREAFRVISAPMDTVNRWTKASGNKNKEAVFVATCDLIAASVVDLRNQPIWTSATVQKMGRANTLRFMDMQLAVLQHNGLTRKVDEGLERMVDAEKKRLDADALEDLLYELCWQIGGDRCLHPRFLKQYLTLRDVAGWIAWLSREPRGERRADWRSALQTLYIRQMIGGEKEDVDSFRLKTDRRAVISNPETAALVDDFFAM